MAMADGIWIGKVELSPYIDLKAEGDVTTSLSPVDGGVKAASPPGYGGS